MFELNSLISDLNSAFVLFSLKSEFLIQIMGLYKICIGCIHVQYVCRQCYSYTGRCMVVGTNHHSGIKTTTKLLKPMTLEAKVCNYTGLSVKYIGFCQNLQFLLQCRPALKMSYVRYSQKETPGLFSWEFSCNQLAHRESIACWCNWL